ncbi:hypothetical protein Cni_G00948 [Canna indica]|uniref:Homeobox domain-containing protein n=1 Tax=Canna indica TaxID=4628 RepID=A0AAQ3Q165_9LILI|nr:hypothetical protein Cni_G00948 [Canna indica]
MVDDISLALELSIGCGRRSSTKSSSISHPPPLTLSLCDGVDQAANDEWIRRKMAAGTPSPHSANSSFSAAYLPGVKKETDLGFEGAEAERLSYRGSDEEDDGGVRKKLRLTKEQSAMLEDRFKEHSTINPKQKHALAEQLNLRPRQIEVWFQNRRARTKLKQMEVDCEFLKKCCQKLGEENRRLQKELQQLKALKAAPPAQLNFPAAAAANLTMCPSCGRTSECANIDGHGGEAAAGHLLVPAKPNYYLCKMQQRVS